MKYPIYMYFKKTILQSKSKSFVFSQSRYPLFDLRFSLRLTPVVVWYEVFRALSRILTLRVSFVAFFICKIHYPLACSMLGMVVSLTVYTRLCILRYKKQSMSYRGGGINVICIVRTSKMINNNHLFSFHI